MKKIENSEVSLQIVETEGVCSSSISFHYHFNSFPSFLFTKVYFSYVWKFGRTGGQYAARCNCK